ncbi:hypothetical protein AB0E10_32780 [Streptomyces sp. NPDC048045]|uniref:hypothetical protein n=1 Tax=Streptomyces sp. NPDC048045 TaxID=3154710 RepID=UPI00343BD66D
MARAFGAMRERVPGTGGGGAVTRRVKVEVNRSLLALAGLVLLGGGLLILIAGLDIYRRHDLVPPVGPPARLACPPRSACR